MSKHAIIKGTFILTATGFISRVIGFFFRIFSSHHFGEEQMGLYQLIFPIYALCYSLSCAGMETALCRSVATKMSRGNKREANILLYQALFLTVFASLILSLLLLEMSTTLSIHVLGDLRCELLLQVLAFILPFSAIHSCICGYYLGLKQTKIPAVSQLIEQLARVGTVYIVYEVLKSKGETPSVWLAVLGLVIGEGVAAIFCIRYFSGRPHTRCSIFSLYKERGHGKELLRLSLPLTSTRVLTNLLQSVETISIPLVLQQYGFTGKEALQTYGVLTGMAFPCIFFPTAITNSVSTMLLPTVAEIEAESNLERLKQLIRRVIYFGFGLGSSCGILFLFCGAWIGKLLFSSALAGDFLQTLAWICPFMYMNSTLISILNGLGKAHLSFLINVCGLLLRILGVFVGISLWGMYGYLNGLLISQLIISLLCVLSLKWYITSRQLE